MKTKFNVLSNKQCKISDFKLATSAVLSNTIFEALVMNNFNIRSPIRSSKKEIMN